MRDAWKVSFPINQCPAWWPNVYHYLFILLSQTVPSLDVLLKRTSQPMRDLADALNLGVNKIIMTVAITKLY